MKTATPTLPSSHRNSTSTPEDASHVIVPAYLIERLCQTGREIHEYSRTVYMLKTLATTRHLTIDEKTELDQAEFNLSACLETLAIGNDAVESGFGLN